MLVIKVELWSAKTGEKTEIGRMSIHNDGTSKSPSKGNYVARTYRGRTQEALTKAMQKQHTTRTATITDHSRLKYHAWHLVGKALWNLGYRG